MEEKELLAFWPVNFAARGEDSLIAGSPNRTEKRFLFRDEEGLSYIAEGYNISKKKSQTFQNILLEFLAENLLAGIHPFYRTLSGEHGAESGNLFWQVRPYIPGGIPPRNTLGEKGEYGFLWGEFLLQMKEIFRRTSAPPPMPNAPFYLTGFLPKLIALAENKMPSITRELQEIEMRLAPFFRWERKAEGMFAHGDFHPGNILMEKEEIRVVIDWEFAGIKFPGYDMALLIGCLAMDHPSNLSGEAVKALQNHLYRNDYLPEEAWDFLPEMIAATRLGWLGEWLTFGEKLLIEQEMELLAILLQK